jgi:tRNA (cytidine/uridine-2'-O-)-methyltransferase
MIHVALIEPEIPPNTGNIARLCAATNSVLHLVGRLGFSLDDRSLKRAGLDYWPHVRLVRHIEATEFWEVASCERFHLFSTRGRTPHTRVAYQDGDFLIFGCEGAGLPAHLLEKHRDRSVRIPMEGPVRSLNLSTAAGIGLFEALRQIRGDLWDAGPSAAP